MSVLLVMRLQTDSVFVFYDVLIVNGFCRSFKILDSIHVVDKRYEADVMHCKEIKRLNKEQGTEKETDYLLLFHQKMIRNDTNPILLTWKYETRYVTQ